MAEEKTMVVVEGCALLGGPYARAGRTDLGMVLQLDCAASAGE